MSMSSATERQQSIAAASCPVFVKLQAASPASICSTRPAGELALPFPKKPRFTGRNPRPRASFVCARARCARRGRCAAAGPVRRHHCGDAGVQRFFNLLRANEVNMRIDPAAVTIFLRRNHLGSRPNNNVHAGCTSDYRLSQSPQSARL